MSTDITNTDIAEIFGYVADLLEMLDKNPFRIRSYREAARSVAEHERRLAAEFEENGPAGLKHLRKECERYYRGKS